MSGVREPCDCGQGYYDPDHYDTCYNCYLDRRSDYLTCIWCGRWHSPNYNTCYQCRAKTPQRDEAGKDLRLEILLRDSFTCCYCHATDGQMQVDHIKPCARGGTADPWNLQTLCHDCNRWKGSSWWVGSRHFAARVVMMRRYLTYLRPYLAAAQREALLADVANICTDSGEWLFANLTVVRPPAPSVVCVDCDVNSTSTTGMCVVCRRPSVPTIPERSAV